MGWHAHKPACSSGPHGQSRRTPVEKEPPPRLRSSPFHIAMFANKQRDRQEARTIAEERMNLEMKFLLQCALASQPHRLGVFASVCLNRVIIINRCQWLASLQFKTEGERSGRCPHRKVRGRVRISSQLLLCERLLRRQAHLDHWSPKSQAARAFDPSCGYRRDVPVSRARGASGARDGRRRP